MGVNASVYRKLKDLPFSNEELRSIDVDPVTGLVDIEGAELYEIWHNRVRAVEKRIGNIALVRFLRTEIERILGNESSRSLLIGKVLYNGVHGGDFIPVECLKPLREEIAELTRAGGPGLSPELKVFLADMEELISASELHGNPIVFS